MTITLEQLRIAFDAAHDNYEAARDACYAAGKAVADAEEKLRMAKVTSNDARIKFEAAAAALKHGEDLAQLVIFIPDTRTA
jgi:hypothetical protein